MLFCCVFFFRCLLFVLLIAKEFKKKKQKIYFKYINQSACIEIEGLEEEFF